MHAYVMHLILVCIKKKKKKAHMLVSVLKFREIQEIHMCTINE